MRGEDVAKAARRSQGNLLARHVNPVWFILAGDGAVTALAPIFNYAKVGS